MKVAFYTLGCKVNQYETQVLRQKFENNGFEIVTPDQMSDVYIINSCTVTATGDKKTRQIIRRLKSINNNAIVVLTGCFPQAFPDEAKKIKEADIITGNKNKDKIYDLVVEKLSLKDNSLPKIYILPNENDISFEKMNISKFEGKTRAFIKIQDGCNRFCSYCIIPKARGRVRSKLIEDIKLEAADLSNNGHKEIVLTGINLSAYGQDINLSLVDAIKAVADIKTVKRVRLSSFEPDVLSLDDIKNLSLIDKFCPHFHLCLQSGCDETLSRMNRHYVTADYLNIINTIRDNFNNPAITTDLMVGFPGETQEEFNKTLDFIKKVNFAKIHVFAYSKRPGTRAALMENQISKAVKHQRSLTVLNIAKEMQNSFLKSQLNSTAEVLFETKIDDNLYQGHSKNYTVIVTFSTENLCGKIKNVKITNIKDDHCQGIIL